MKFSKKFFVYSSQGSECLAERAGCVRVLEGTNRQEKEASLLPHEPENLSASGAAGGGKKEPAAPVLTFSLKSLQSVFLVYLFNSVFVKQKKTMALMPPSSFYYFILIAL